MPRFSADVFLVAITILQVLLSPDIPFYVQLYFLSKDSHGDVDVFVDEEHREKIRFYYGLDPTFEACPNGDICRDRVTKNVGDDDVLVEFKYSQYPKESAFAGSYGGIFHILLLPCIRAMYGKIVSIKDGHVVFKEGNVVVPIMTLQQFLKQHNFDLHASQDYAFHTINDFFEAWSKSTCFVPSAIVHEVVKPKKRDDRVFGMYNAFTEWLSSVDKLLEESVLTPEQCQQKAEEAFPEACLRFQQALDAEREAVKRIDAAKKVASVASIVALGAIGPIDKTQFPRVASVSRFIQGTQNEKDMDCITCKKCIALHEQFKAMHGGGDIYTAITKTCGTEAWKEYMKGMWVVYNGA
jgi:hypothetical protein